ncbi:MAG: ATP-binding cassette domain-containing protein [Lachnospiraceae bacterium]|nr:ATP-binding cassette domain-containing protein [Lachnospiraceae bacterium]
MIEFRHVDMAFPSEGGREKSVFRDFSLSIEDGELTVFTGQSGIGKSTLIHLLLRDYVPTGGDILVNGKSLKRMKNSQVPYYRQGIGVVFQDFRLLNDRTVYDNIALAQLVAGGRTGGSRAKIAGLLKLLHLERLHNRYPEELSGGEKQRVCLARALMNHPSILLADEPTANLDPANSEGLKRIFEIIHSQGTTVVIATHDPILQDSRYARIIPLSDPDDLPVWA